jgi:hypothetical protein
MSLKKTITILFFSIGSLNGLIAQKSVARQWNEVALTAIKNDFARPTVHARNLFHISVLMYDSWAVYDPIASTYFLGKNKNGYQIEFEGIANPTDRKKAAETTLSFACYRLIKERFRLSPKAALTFAKADSLFAALGLDVNFTSDDYTLGNYAALGNYLANQMIAYGLQDGSNEANKYANLFYQPKNKGLAPIIKGNPNLVYQNNWQPMILEVFVDQSGNTIQGNAQPFLGPEWGNVNPFSLTPADKSVKTRDGHDYNIYLDPGLPPLIDSSGISDLYKWNFLLVSMWGSHLHPSDSVKWDISPASQGNLTTDLTQLTDLRAFYNDTLGGDLSTGYSVNPITGQPYTPNLVNRGDYTRVLAEFWADGPQSVTPPGHWFSLLNYVSDQPQFEKKYKGSGQKLGDLEWDVKSYFVLGGAMHDCAIAAWGIKGYYDYLRPLSAIRYMASKGQSTDKSLPSYSPHGMPLLEGFSELVKVGDALAGINNQNVGKIKLYTWRGPRYISNPTSDDAGVGWILGEDWWPYQRPTFVNPPFAGYVSGHSTFSRAAAEVMSAITGSPFFPNGMGEFKANKNEFLVFEEGPSKDITLQWATYVDASNQTSLSRIWGGIHPPCDDIPGRIIGLKIAPKAVELADSYFNGQVISKTFDYQDNIVLYPNPMQAGKLISLQIPKNSPLTNLSFYTITGEKIGDLEFEQIANEVYFYAPNLANSNYIAKAETEDNSYSFSIYFIN